MRCASLFGFPTLTSASFAQVFQGLGVVSGQNASVANAISSDGTTVVGTSIPFGGVAWRWTASTSRIDLGAAPGGFQMIQANDVSSDGSVIVGSMQTSTAGFAW